MTPSPLRRTLIASALLHTAVAATLWLSVTDYVVDAVKPPEVIDTTILPPPEVVTKAPAPAITEKPKHTAQGKASAKGTQSAIKTENGENTANNGQANSAGLNNKADQTGDSTGQGVAGEDNGAQDTANATELPSGVPIKVAVKDGGFNMLYDAKILYNGSTFGGGGSLVFVKKGAGYEASLSAKASGFGISATSLGEIRSDTIAAVRFNERILIPIVKDKFHQFVVDYPNNQWSPGTGGESGIKPLGFKSVQDYLSAIIYVQAVLQSHKQTSSITMPIIKRSSVEQMTVHFGAQITSKPMMAVSK